MIFRKFASVFGAAAVVASLSAATVTLQQGLNGYSGCTDRSSIGDSTGQGYSLYYAEEYYPNGNMYNQIYSDDSLLFTFQFMC